MGKSNHLMAIGIVGAGTMGSGIAQVIAASGHRVFLCDTQPEAIARAKAGITKALKREVEKERLSNGDAEQFYSRITFLESLDTHCLQSFLECGLVIEAVVEQLPVKQETFQKIEAFIPRDSILATNTSALSIASIAASCKSQERVIGLHFFNPAPLMPLVEVVPGISASPQVVERACELVRSWNKIPVVAKDTPGFIVNRIARPYYGEAIRIYEESLADIATIDWAMRELGGFRMGPFELMDLIGNDINLKVTETVFEAFFYDPRYRPSFTQKRMVEAKLLGRKTGKGYYDYTPGLKPPEPNRDTKLGQAVLHRILCMLINEAIEAVHYKIASPQDIDLAMEKGVNYPKGLLKWGEELGLDFVLKKLSELQSEYGEDRYRPSALLRRMVKGGQKFYG